MGALVTNHSRNVTTLGEEPRKRAVSTIRNVTTLVAIVTMMAACQTANKGSFGGVAHPVRLSDSAIDALTDAEAEKLLAFNRKGAALCGWRP